MANKAFDPSKFRRSITKSITGMSAGFHDPKTWIDTGNYMLNYLISGDFHKGVPMGKVSVFAGESGCLPLDAKVTIRSKADPDAITTITVGQLDTFYHSNYRGQFEISTPDGFCDIINWYDKGELSMVNVVTKKHKTKCAYNHLIETANNEWIQASRLTVGTLVKTESGHYPVLDVQNTTAEKCYDFEIDHPNHRYWGDGFSSHNSGKSYVCSGNIVRDAQRQGIFVVLIDSENALDEAWLRKLGVDTSEDKLLKLNMAMIDDVAKTISTFMSEYKEIEPADRPPVLFVIDSLGMLMSPTELKQFDDGDLKGDMGRKAKALKALVTNCVNMFGEYEVGMVATNHTYAAQGMYPTESQVVSGGAGFVFASSILVLLSKMKLREDENGAVVKDVNGIRAGCKVIKTRYNKPFESVEVHIPYDTGMSKYSGLFEFFLKKGILVKTGNRYEYTCLDGTVLKDFKKNWTNEMFDRVIQEYDDAIKLTPPADIEQVQDYIEQQHTEDNDDE